MPATDRYRLALLQAYVTCEDDARLELSTELAHQRDMERFFLKIEAWTLIFVAVVAGFVACIGIFLIANGAQIPGAITLSSDVLSLAGIALGRSYFIDRQSDESGSKSVEKAKSKKPKSIGSGEL